MRSTIWGALLGTAFSIQKMQVGPYTTRLLDAGSGDQALVLMPGTGGHLEAYARNVAAFADRYRVIAYDYPGHGWSTLADHDLEISDYIEHLTRLLDIVHIDRAHLIGESLGGWVAAKFAVARPDRTGKLVLNTPGGTMSNPVVMERIRSLTQAAADDPSPERVRARLEWLMADPSSVTDELVEIRRAIYARPGFADSMRHVLCLQDPDVRRRNLITDDELAAIAGPALVVWTSNDPSGPAAEGKQIADRIPTSRFQLIDHAGHWPQWEQSAQFNGTVLDFLAE